jgi:hypothetical protein
MEGDQASQKVTIVSTDDGSDWQEGHMTPKRETPDARRPMPGSRDMTFVILMAAVAASCAPIPRVESSPTLVRLTLAGKLLHPGEALAAIRRELDRAGLTGIRNVPDGWQ